jgi:hypothetical protein
MTHLISTNAISPFDVTNVRPIFESNSQDRSAKRLLHFRINSCNGVSEADRP